MVLLTIFQGCRVVVLIGARAIPCSTDDQGVCEGESEVTQVPQKSQERMASLWIDINEED